MISTRLDSTLNQPCEDRPRIDKLVSDVDEIKNSLQGQLGQTGLVASVEEIVKTQGRTARLLDDLERRMRDQETAVAVNRTRIAMWGSLGGAGISALFAAMKAWATTKG